MRFGDEWGGGDSAVVVRPEEFAGIDRACVMFLEVVESVSLLAGQISSQMHWGLGEGDGRLISGPTLVGRFRETAEAVGAAMETHRRIVGDFREAHRLARDRLVAVDEEWALRLADAEAALGTRDPFAVGAR
ncbi:hypothetical protein [Nocardia ignorata]|uniref:Excreted virulence factor EspC (Type VII ESX diderm) n=1 Tax=Nocardia ignorata TaxID=145285 RepID=A0A4V3CPN6_NOCIG|nr:hypothetical protein [Nocardia ignorata]TDP38702.1 hypothetical protein DFR75_103359 [Nocardia ignorata]